MDCTMVAAAPVLPVGYVVSASWIADRFDAGANSLNATDSVRGDLSR